MTTDNHINYIELYAPNLDLVKTFYTTAFGWEFVDYGPTYTAFTAQSAGIDGGFEQRNTPTHNGVLVVLYHEHLEQALEAVTQAGGTISKDIFEFPGGRRFHFVDPASNELAVWSAPSE